MSVWTIVVAAGSGTRFGGAKQYELIGGRSVLARSLEVARATTDGVVLVVGADRTHPDHRADVVVAGGSTRAASVRAGLAAVPAEVQVIVVHDAARPLATATLFERVIDAVASGAPAAIAAIPVVDTIKQVSGDVVAATLDRSELVAVQTPQAFRADVLRRAHDAGFEGTDDASLVERLGEQVHVVEGERSNLKITDRSDLAVAEMLLG